MAMPHQLSLLLGVLLLLTVAGCASSRPLPRPLLEPSGGITATGTSKASQDWRKCHQAVWDTAPRSIQPHRWIPPVIAPGGVVVGTMDVPHAVLSREDYQTDLARCLKTRGYTIRGWQ